MEKMLTPQEVAEALQVSKPTVYRLARQGILPKSVKIGRQRRWPEEAMRKALTALSEKN